MEDDLYAFDIGLSEASDLSPRERPRRGDLRYSARTMSQSSRQPRQQAAQAQAPYPSPGRGVSGESSN